MSDDGGIKSMNDYLDGLDKQWSPTGGVRPSSKKRLIKFDDDRTVKAKEKRERAKNPSTRRLDAIE